jgi:hypothetical protein
LSVTASYQLIARNLERQLQITASSGPTKLETAYYAENAPKIRTLDEFLANTRVFRYAMKAFGLEELSNAKGYIRKLIEGGVTDPKSLANRTTDLRLRDFARTFDFSTYGAITMERTATKQAIVDRYVRQTLETTAGEENEGIRLALYFQRMAPTIKTAYEILADAALSKVVRTVLGLPKEFAAVDIDRQASVINGRLNVADFQDPAKLARFMTRFTASWDATEGGSSDPRLLLFSGSGGNAASLSLDLAMTLSSLRLGGA